jgi:hypothetical protein
MGSGGEQRCDRIRAARRQNVGTWKAGGMRPLGEIWAQHKPPNPDSSGCVNAQRLPAFNGRLFGPCVVL